MTSKRDECRVFAGMVSDQSGQVPLESLKCIGVGIMVAVRSLMTSERDEGSSSAGNVTDQSVQGPHESLEYIRVGSMVAVRLLMNDK